MTQDDKIRHDFKNQLTIIRGFAEILINAEPDNQRRRDLEEIHKAAATALTLLARMYPNTADPHT